MTKNDEFLMSCPVLDAGASNRISLAHGEGGRLMRHLIHRDILPALDNEYLRPGGDAAMLPACRGSIAMTTDSFVVSPLLYPGGNIGSLAVFGTVNDLAVAGAEPQWMTLSLILEEGLETNVLRQVIASVAAAARRARVLVVAGDTKVVPRGAADGLFINTAGLGEVTAPVWPGPASLEVGDEIIVSGPIGRHGMAVMTARHELAFDLPPTSDSAPLRDAVSALREANVAVRALRDATRGGLGAVLQEWAEASGKTLAVEEDLLPVTADVRGACELLGLDPIHVACEGTMVGAVPQGQAQRTITALAAVAETAGAALIGRVERQGLAAVVVQRAVGRRIPLDEPLGAPLPRIC